MLSVLLVHCILLKVIELLLSSLILRIMRRTIVLADHFKWLLVQWFRWVASRTCYLLDFVTVFSFLTCFYFWFYRRCKFHFKFNALIAFTAWTIFIIWSLRFWFFCWTINFEVDCWLMRILMWNCLYNLLCGLFRWESFHRITILHWICFLFLGSKTIFRDLLSAFCVLRLNLHCNRFLTLNFSMGLLELL